MMKNLVKYSGFLKLNEYGWDSSDELGEISVNNVTLKTRYVCSYDTPNFISLQVYVSPSNKELLSMGIYSAKYFKTTEPDEKRLLIFSNGIELSSAALRKLNANNVRDLNDSDVIEKYIKSYNKKTKNGVLTPEEFVELVKELDESEYEDIIVIKDKQGIYNLLGGIDAL